MEMKLGFATVRHIIRNLSFMMSTVIFPFFPSPSHKSFEVTRGDYIIDSKGVNSKFGENWAPQYVCSAAGRKSNPGPGIGQINLSSPIDTKFHSREKVACIN